MVSSGVSFLVGSWTLQFKQCQKFWENRHQSEFQLKLKGSMLIQKLCISSTKEYQTEHESILSMPCRLS
jgi:hypothetical protein